MSEEKPPEDGARCMVKTAGGEECAVWTGHIWASEDGSRLIDSAEIQSWKPAEPLPELTVTYPEGVTKEG